MKTLQLTKDLYWTGVLDPDLRVFDIIMETEFGTTYNSYILKGRDGVVLFETAKVKFLDSYLESLEKLIDIQDINYIVVNHTEPDHAGSVEKLIDINPNIQVVGTATAINFLKNIVNKDFYSITVKENDTLSLGDKTLRFFKLPNLHWPDSMYTYVEEDKLLFTCDSFGSHYSFEDILLSKVTDNEGYMRATKYYFDNIIGPFKPYMIKALDRIKDLDIDMICTGHGPVIDSRINEIQQIYREWCTVINPNPKKTVIIPYVSAYGYTKELAETISKGVADSGDVDVRSYDMVVSDQGKVLEELGFADGILFGTPTIVGEALKPIWDLTTSIFAGTHGGKLASAFGSYGWSGEGVPNIMERLKQLKMKTVDGFKIRFKPSEVELVEAYEYGFNFGCILQNKENPRKNNGGRRLVKCLVCGEIFEEGLDTCPVCGVGKENFVPADVEDVTFRSNTEEIFLILGNGAAGINAAEAIRERNQTCQIVMVSNENITSYNRPMLTKSMLAHFQADQIQIHDDAWYKEKNIQNVLDRTVKEILPDEKIVVFDDGIKLKYDKCIYALGAECFIPPIKGRDKENVVSIRKVADVNKVASLLGDVKNVVIIGGGVLGLEAAWEFAKSKCTVTVLEGADKLMGRQLDDNASDVIRDIAKGKGIDILLNAAVSEIAGDKKVSSIKLKDSREISADLVVISTGIAPNVEIAKAAGIETERFIVVNEKMETSVKDIYACGDCAQYNGLSFGIWPQAVEMGKTAGANAAGDTVEYETVNAGLSFHGMGTALYAIGDNGKKENLKYKTVEFKDPTKNSYEKYYFVNNRLFGAILIGDVSKLAKVTEDVERHTLFKNMF